MKLARDRVYADFIAEACSSVTVFTMNRASYRCAPIARARAQLHAEHRPQPRIHKAVKAASASGGVLARRVVTGEGIGTTTADEWEPFT